MGGLFNLDNPVWRFIGKLADVFILSILWFVCCIPIITIGASTTAMYYVTLKLAEDNEGYTVRGFFKSFVMNFKQSTIVWLILLVVGLLLGFDIVFFLRMESNAGMILAALVGAILIMYVFVLTYIFPIIARFYNTTKRTFLNALLMSIRHLLMTICAIVINVAVWGLSLTIIPPLIMVAPGLSAFLCSYPIAKVFSNYMPKEETVSEEEESFRIIQNLNQEIAEAEAQRETAQTESTEETNEGEIQRVYDEEDSRYTEGGENVGGAEEEENSDDERAF